MKKDNAKKTNMKMLIINFVIIGLLLAFIPVSFAWFINSKETNTNFGAPTVDNKLEIKAFKIFKNGELLTEESNIFVGLIPNDSFIFELTVIKKSNAPLVLEVGYDGISGDVFTGNDNNEYTTMHMFSTVALNGDTEAGARKWLNTAVGGKLVVIANYSYTEAGMLTIKLKMDFDLSQMDHVTTETLSNKKFDMKGIYIKAVD